MNKHPFERILLATEHTEFDVGAERLAFAMARQCGMPLRVVIPVLSNPEFEAAAPELALRADEAIALKVSELEAQAAAAGVELDVKVRHGAQANEEIVDEATRTQTDLIIVRRRGTPSFLANLLVGEMVSKVIRDAACHVLMVPRAAQFWQHHVLAAVGQGSAAANVANVAASIAARCEVPLTLVSVASDEGSHPEMTALNAQQLDQAKAIYPATVGRIAQGHPVEQTVALAQELAADLLVVGKQRHHFIPFAGGGGTIMQKIAGALIVPTLVVHH